MTNARTEPKGKTRTNPRPGATTSPQDTQELRGTNAVMPSKAASKETDKGFIMRTARHDQFVRGRATRYLVESFTLCSEDYTVARKGLQRAPDSAFSKKSSDQRGRSPVQERPIAVVRSFCRKVGDLQLGCLNGYFDRYSQAVNLVLQRIYSDPARASQLGSKLSAYNGFGHTLLAKETDLSYHNNECFRQTCF